MKLVIAIVLLFTLTANAQKAGSNVDSARTVIAPTHFTHTDTVRAFQQLFKNRRTRGALLLGGTGALVAASNVALNNESGIPSSDVSSNLIVASGIALFYTTPIWVVGTSQLVRFSQKKEKAIIDEFMTKHTLPRKIQRRLKPSLFASR